MSENPPPIPPPESHVEEHDPPELDIANVPNALGSQKEAVRDSSSPAEHLAPGRIQRIAKSVGDWASTGYMKAHELQYGKNSRVDISPEDPSPVMENSAIEPKETEPERLRQAVLKNEKTLVTIGSSMGLHRGRQYYYIPELRRSVPADELIFGKFETEEPGNENGESEQVVSDEDPLLSSARLGEGGDKEPPDKPPESPPGKGPEEPEEDFGLPPDIIEKARTFHIPLESVKKAIDAQYENPIKTLAAARENEEMRRSMERLGFKLPPLSSQNETDENQKDIQPLPEDQFVEQQVMGDWSRDRAAELDKEIRNHPARLRRRLGKLKPGAYGLQYIPLVGPPLARYMLSWQMLRKHKQVRPKKDAKGDGLKYNDGHLGWGRKKRRMYSKAIKDQDHKLTTARGKLSRLDRKAYTSDEIPSQRYILAEEIRDIEKQAEAFRQRLLNPGDLYVSEAERNRRKRFEEHPDAPGMRERILGLEERRKRKGEEAA